MFELPPPSLGSLRSKWNHQSPWIFPWNFGNHHWLEDHQVQDLHLRGKFASTTSWKQAEPYPWVPKIKSMGSSCILVAMFVVETFFSKWLGCGNCDTPPSLLIRTSEGTSWYHWLPRKEQKTSNFTANMKFPKTSHIDCLPQLRCAKKGRSFRHRHHCSPTALRPQQPMEKWRFYTPKIWVTIPKNEGCGFPWCLL